MRDSPEPDQDTSLDILETWDLGDYEDALAERAETEFYEERTRTEEADAQLEDHPYADWIPNTCDCCGTTDLYPNSSYCASCSQSMEIETLGDQYENEYAEYRKTLEKLWNEARITKIHADITQAEANIARITADIAEAKSEIAKANYRIADSEGDCGQDWLANAEVNLIEAEASLGEAEAVLSNARTIGVTHAAVAIAQNDVRNAEATVQAKKDAKDIAIEFRETSEPEYLVEESKLLDEGAHVEYIHWSEQQNGIIEIGFCCEWVHIEYINALIDLAEAQDALDLAEVRLTKTPSLCLIHGYGFASHEPRCPTSDIAE